MGLDEIRASINKKFKAELLTDTDTYVGIDRIPFSSPRLNYLTRGGIPWPGATELSGPESSGKTTLLGDLIANAQKMGLMCAFTDTENKAQPLDALILTPDGFKRMGDMKIGDLIYGEDGDIHKVIGVYPQGEKDIYRVTFTDGTSTECCGEHLWMVQHINDRQYMLANNKPEDYNFQVLRLEQIIADGIKIHSSYSKSGTNKYYVPVNKAIKFNSTNELKLHPYLLGVLLGDGGIANTVSFTSTTNDIVNRISDIVSKYNCKLVQDSNDKNSWFIRKDSNERNTWIPNPIKEILKELKLFGHRSWEKFIPKEYLFSSINDRIELLRGLIDTDGFVKGTQSYHYVTTSKQLSNDVAFLARSLGCVVVEHERESYYKKKDGEKIKCRNKYELHINTPDWIIPFYTSERSEQYNRAKNKHRKRKGHFLKKAIDSIELISRKECQCIRTDNPTGLYITNEFIVTHNTDLDYWKFLGVDIDNLLLCKPIGVSGEDLLQLQFELMNEGVQFLGLDSIASLVPKAVLTGTMDDKTYCGSSGIVSTFSQKLMGSGILIEKKAVMVGINQVRDKMNGFGLQTPGGHFWRHACLCRLQLQKGNPFDHNYKEMALSTIEQPLGHKIEVRMLKNQFTKNDRRFNMCTLNYEIGIDVFEDAIDVGIDLEIIQKGGAWYRLVNCETGEILCMNGNELKFQGRANLRNYMMENPRIGKWLLGQISKYIAE